MARESESPNHQNRQKKKRRHEADERSKGQLIFYITQVARGYQGENLWPCQQLKATTDRRSPSRTTIPNVAMFPKKVISATTITGRAKRVIENEPKETSKS
jgi:hypothetical protein